MDTIKFMAAWHERNQKTEMLIDLLYEVVERTENHCEGYFAIRRYVDLSFGITHRYAILDMMADPDLRAAMVQDLDNMLATLQTDIDRIDS